MPVQSKQLFLTKHLLSEQDKKVYRKLNKSSESKENSKENNFIIKRK